jgi:hypothetical protein
VAKQNPSQNPSQSPGQAFLSLIVVKRPLKRIAIISRRTRSSHHIGVLGCHDWFSTTSYPSIGDIPPYQCSLGQLFNFMKAPSEQIKLPRT